MGSGGVEAVRQPRRRPTRASFRAQHWQGSVPEPQAALRRRQLGQRLRQPSASPDPPGNNASSTPQAQLIPRVKTALPTFANPSPIRAAQTATTSSPTRPEERSTMAGLKTIIALSFVCTVPAFLHAPSRKFHH